MEARTHTDAFALGTGLAATVVRYCALKRQAQRGGQSTKLRVKPRHDFCKSAMKSGLQYGCESKIFSGRVAVSFLGLFAIRRSDEFPSRSTQPGIGARPGSHWATARCVGPTDRRN